jgi:hypothetical protein
MTTTKKKCFQLVALMAFTIGGVAFLATPRPAAAFFSGCMGTGGAGCYDDTCSGTYGPYQCCVEAVNTYCGL